MFIVSQSRVRDENVFETCQMLTTHFERKQTLNIKTNANICTNFHSPRQSREVFGAKCICEDVFGVDGEHEAGLVLSVDEILVEMFRVIVRALNPFLFPFRPQIHRKVRRNDDHPSLVLRQTLALVLALFIDTPSQESAISLLISQRQIIHFSSPLRARSRRAKEWSEGKSFEHYVTSISPTLVSITRLRSGHD